jgi:hypothetical protein
VAPIGPGSAAYATVVIALLVVYFVMGISEIYIDGAHARRTDRAGGKWRRRSKNRRLAHARYHNVVNQVRNG